MADLRTKYLGFELSCPLVAAASPITSRVDDIKALEDCGVGAVTLPSLFEEQVEHEQRAVHELRSFGVEAPQPASGAAFPPLAVVDSIGGHSGTPAYAFGPSAAGYLKHIREAKRAVNIPVIASMNGVAAGQWLEYARHIQEEGADAVELSIYYIAADPSVAGPDVESRFTGVVRALRETVKVPIVVKIPPYLSAPAHTVRELAAAGAQGVVLFNRLVEPDIDLGSLEVQPTMRLSISDEVRTVLRWMAILYGKVDCDLGASTGAHSPEDVLKLLLSGADVVTMASALMRNGADHISVVREAISQWLDDRGYESVAQLRGNLSQVNSPDPVAFERASYMKALLNYSPPE